jgi:hypothetical protein
MPLIAIGHEALLCLPEPRAGEPLLPERACEKLCLVTTFAPNVTIQPGGKGRSQFVPVLRHYRVETVATPHSKQGLFSDVINPQAGHILCDRTLAVCGMSLRIERSSRIVKITINSPKAILVAFIRPTLLGDINQASRANGYGRTCQSLYSLKNLRWENFRWTGLGQKT